MQSSEGRPRHGQSAGQNGLEDRLRNLILTNAPPGTSQAQPSEAPRTGARLSGDATSASIVSNDHSSALPSADEKLPGSPKVSRKRPNQAQRRQMNAQLSIPIDPRPSPPTNYGRPFSGSPGHSSNQPAFHHGGGRHHHGPPYHGQGPAQGQYGGAQPHTPRHNGPRHPGNLDTSRHHNEQHHFARQDNGSPRYPRSSHGQLYSPRGAHYQVRPEELENQSAYLEGLCGTIVAGAEIERDDIAEKENFRLQIEQVCQLAVAEYEQKENNVQNFPPQSVELKCFGSLSSGFATKASDMDLGLVSPLSQPQPDAAGSPIPRIIEKAFLELGLGARLLTRTRVPIIKLCQNPPERLRLDLLEEREKWEKGINDADHADGAEEDEHADGDVVHGKETTDDSTDDPAAHKSDVPSPPLPSSEEAKALNLRQSAHMSLPAYYNLAKRKLRQLGGRDVTVSNCRELADEDLVLLTNVCEAFFHGLQNGELKDRLSKYLSLSFKPLPNVPNYRALAGVYAQMEGERIVMLCDENLAVVGPEDAEDASRMLISNWKSLQDQGHFGIEPLTYTKQVQLLLEKLKKLPVAQLLTLEQSQHEAAGSYHTRAERIVSQLRPRDADSLLAAQQLIIDKYTTGIWTNSIRDDVKEFIGQIPANPSILAVTRRHKSLQLASELEKALEHKLYDTALEKDIREYISILRGPMRKSSAEDPHYDYVIPVTKENIETIKRMREIKDPAKMSVNQPRDPYRDKLEFPKSGVGVQCDINFSAHLALQNTLLLRCYSHTDPRVRPLVLFIKHWAKVRGINTPYRGTLSSYGYVLMMLHYLVNVVQPFVCPNLQALGPPPPPEGVSPAVNDDATMCRGRFVGFWRDEAKIRRLAQMNQLNGNRESIGHLLRGFFEYYAQNGNMSTYPGRGYDWGRDVLSIRTPGGLLSKSEKGWTGAKTVIEYRPNAVNSPSAETPSPAAQFALKSPVDPLTPTAGAADAAQEAASPTVSGSKPTAAAAAGSHKNGEVKEVRHRYLFAIEDPFELDHNVARTVTHNGIVSIRDEFRRAWRIIKAAGTGNFGEELLQDVAAVKEEGEKGTYLQLLDEIHGWELF